MKIYSKKTLAIAALLSLGILGGCGTTTTPEVSIEQPVSTTAISKPTSTPAPTTDNSVATFINKADNIAIKGTDPVAYFTESKAVQGNADFTYEWNDATWHFASAENRDLFSANPEKYAPKYGGYCAWAASQGYTADIDPEAWTIVDGSLYLNFNQKIQERWEKDIPGFISDADSKWESVVRENS